MHIFSGVKVLDCTKVYSGPLATRMLADYGATVIKIENPDKPDDSRHFPPLIDGTSGYFETLNRNKDFISLDFKKEADLKKFYELVKTCDVFVENMTPSTKHKLKIDYETLKKINPNIIYASLSGVSQKEDRKYYDVLAQAESGLLSLTGTKEVPIKIGPAVVDAFSGITLAFAISSALYHRKNTGEGQNIEVSMIGSAMNLLENNLAHTSITKNNIERTGNIDTAIAPFGIYKTKDGYIALACGNNDLWIKLQEYLSVSTSIDNSLFTTNELRLKNQDKLTKLIEESFSKEDTETLIKKLVGTGVPCGRVATILDVINNKEYFEMDALIKLNHETLGEYVAPGRAINFEKDKEIIKNVGKEVGADNNKYGI